MLLDLEAFFVLVINTFIKYEMIDSLIDLHERLVKRNFLDRCHDFAFEFLSIKIPCLHGTMCELEKFVIQAGGQLIVAEEELLIFN